MWSCGIALFFILFMCPLCSLSTSVCICLCLHLSITIIFLSISLKSLWVYFSLWCFLLTFLLIFYISWTFPLSPGFFFQLSLLFQLGERLGELIIHCFISDKQCDHSQFSSLLYFEFLPCKRGEESPFTSFPELLWEGYNGVATAMLVAVMLRLPIYQAPYIHHFTIPRISYLEGLNHYIPSFYRRGEWDPTWSYG